MVIGSNKTLEQRIERLEAKLDRIAELLEAGAGSGHPPAPATGAPAQTAGSEAHGPGVNAGPVPATSPAGPFAEAARETTASLGAVYGEEAVRASLGEVLLRIGDPEVLESIARIGSLVPKVEYAVQALSAGPEVLEEGLEAVRHRLQAESIDAADLSQRLDAATQAVALLSQPALLKVLTRIGSRASDLEPAASGAADALHALQTVETPAELQARVADALVRIAEPEALASLTRIAELSPKIEYAVQALAAGPALLEDALTDVRERLARSGSTPHDLQLRLNQAADLLTALSAPAALDAVGSLGTVLPDLVPVTRALGQAFRALSDHEGADALTARLTESLIRIAEPEVFDALTRTAQLLPQLEYAVNALAAGPAILEEGLDMVRGWSDQQDARGSVDDRLKAALRIGEVLSSPTVLGGIEHLTTGLKPLLENEQALEAVSRIAQLAPRFEGSLREFAELVDRVELERLIKLAETTADPTIHEALHHILQLAPELERPLAALPVQPLTLGILRSLNHAVEQAAAEKSEVGFFGLLTALSKPEVRRAAGLGISVAEKLGQHLKDNNLTNGTPKALGPGES